MRVTTVRTVRAILWGALWGAGTTCCAGEDAPAREKKDGRDAGVLDAGGESDRGDARPGDGARPACGGRACDGKCIAGRCLETLARIDRPSQLAVGGSAVYVAGCAPGRGEGGVFTVPSAGGSLRAVSSGTACATGLFVEPALLYVAGLDGDVVTAVDLDTGRASPLVTLDGPVLGITADSTSVYFTAGSALEGSGDAGAARPGSWLGRVPRAGGPAEILAEGPNRWSGPQVDDAYAYFADDRGTLSKVPLAGGATSVVTTADTITTPVLSRGEIFFGAGYIVMKVPVTGGAPITLGTAAGAEVVAVAVDSTNSYVSSAGELWRIPRDGGATTFLAGNQAGCNAIAVDDTSVYWLNGDAAPGSVMKLTPK